MADLLLVGFGVALFALVGLYIAACQRLLSREDSGEERRGRGAG